MNLNIVWKYIWKYGEESIIIEISGNKKTNLQYFKIWYLNKIYFFYYIYMNIIFYSRFTFIWICRIISRLIAIINYDSMYL